MDGIDGVSTNNANQAGAEGSEFSQEEIQAVLDAVAIAAAIPIALEGMEDFEE